MTSSGSMPMDISSDETEYKTCPTSISTADNTPGGVKLYEGDDVRNFKRSRFDEVEGYKQVGHVGSGGYGNCLLLQKKSSMRLCVCKVQKRPKDISESLEINILRDILYDHPRIVRLHEAIFHTQKMQLYFDFYPGGDLYGVITRYVDMWAKMPESFIWHCFLQLSEALAYIHHGYDRRQLCGPPPPSEWQTIIHGDIKPENVFLGPPTPDSHGYPSLVLGDFGLATTYERPVPGTFIWQPPEMPMASTKADVWALGALIHALSHDGRPPLRPRPEGMSRHDFARWPAARMPQSLLGLYSTELHNLVIHGTLQFDPRARFSSLEVLCSVIDEVEMGVASDIGWEPLISPELATKTYDENGVTEGTTVSSEDYFHESDTMSLDELEQAVYNHPMEFVPCD